MYREQGIVSFRPLVHPTASIEERAEELLSAVYKQIGKSEPFHIIAHSMGGLDSRFLASPNGLGEGERVLSITTLSTPHWGSPLAERIPAPLRTAYSTGAGILRNMLSNKDEIFLLDGIAENRWDGILQLTPTYMEEIFNPLIVDDPSVCYFSYAGSLAMKKGRPLLKGLRNLANQILRVYQEANDGMVTVRSAKWGEFKEVLPADHGEQVGLQLIPWQKNSFDHLPLFRRIAKDLERLETG